MKMSASLVLVASMLAPLSGAETIALTGGIVHPIDGPDLPNGTVVIRGGKIIAVGADVAVPSDAKVVDVRGKHVYPSLLPPFTTLGLVEISAVRATVDTAETGEINPEARAEIGVNLDSEILPVTRSAGVLVAGITPAGGLISGSAAVMRLTGWTRDDALVRAPAALTVNWPEMKIDRSPHARTSVRVQERRRDEAIERLKKAFADARAYGQARTVSGKNGIPQHDFDAKLEALQPAVERRVPVIVRAETVQQIRAVLAWAREENLRLVIAGGDDAWRVADEIARADVPVIVGNALGLPARPDDPYDAPFANAGILARAGVRLAFNVAAPTFVRNLGHYAASAVAHGLPRDKALAGMTLEPARILGVDDRLGSLAPGKDATLFVSDGDVLDLRSTVVAAYLDGEALDLSDRHKRLWERYRGRPKAARVDGAR